MFTVLCSLLPSSAGLSMGLATLCFSLRMGSSGEMPAEGVTQTRGMKQPEPVVCVEVCVGLVGLVESEIFYY